MFVRYIFVGGVFGNCIDYLYWSDDMTKSSHK